MDIRWAPDRSFGRRIPGGRRAPEISNSFPKGFTAEGEYTASARGVHAGEHGHKKIARQIATTDTSLPISSMLGFWVVNSGTASG